MHISTTTQLILLISFALVLNLWSLNTMLLLLFASVLLFAYLKNSHFYRLMKRLKWFYLVMFIIFLFNTPGQHIGDWPLSVKPTYEGLEMGVMQVLRVALVLAMLSLILTQNTKQQLISSLYFFMKPFSHIGLDAQRFSARLWLTLHYVELRQANNNDVPVIKNLSKSLDDVFADEVNEDIVIELEKPMFSWVDYVVLTVLCIIIIGLLG